MSRVSRGILSAGVFVSDLGVVAPTQPLDEEGEERRAKQFPKSPPVTVYFTNVYP